VQADPTLDDMLAAAFVEDHQPGAEPPPGQHVQVAEDLADAVQERPAHAVVEVALVLPEGAVPQQLIAVGD
jgi:hypothetical protein